jgi:hypothetical protein
MLEQGFLIASEQYIKQLFMFRQATLRQYPQAPQASRRNPQTCFVHDSSSLNTPLNSCEEQTARLLVALFASRGVVRPIQQSRCHIPKELQQPIDELLGP